MSVFNYFKNVFSSKSKSKYIDDLKGIEYADAVFHNLIVEHKIPGISVAILQKGDMVVQKGYGFANIEERMKIHPKKTLFRIASISKCITALAFGKMVEEGILDWEDSLYKHVPFFPKKKHDFTLEQLAAHTAGIRGYKGKEYALNRPYSIKDSLEMFQDDDLKFKPGMGYLYNSVDFVLLSVAMQEASGVAFEDYVREKVLHPLKLKHTYAPNEKELSLRAKRDISISEFYTKRATGFRKAVEVSNFYKLAGGGFLSTSHDIASLGQAILEQRLLKKETWGRLLTAQTVNGKSNYYGLGFQVSQDSQGRAFVGHVGNSVGAYTNFFVYPKDNCVFSILTNCTNPGIQKDIDRAVAAILE